MCVCDLGGVYIKPTRPWVVVPLPSPLATIKRRRPASCRPVVVVSSAVLSCRVLSCRVLSCRVLSSSRPVVSSVCCRRLSSVVSQLLRFEPSFCAIPFTLFTRSKFISLREISACCPRRFNPYFPCPDFTDSMHFLSRIFFFELLTLTKRAL